MSSKIAKIVYLDASSALRWVLKTPGIVADFGKWSMAGSSVLFEIECIRTVERLFDEGQLTAEQYADAVTQVCNLWDAMEKIPIDADIISGAKRRFVAPIKTLDAIHAVSAQLWSKSLDEEVLLISHDKKLNLIAKSLGLKTLESK